VALSLDWTVAALAGGFSGRGTRTDSGGLGVIQVSLDPTWKGPRFELAVPVDLAHEQTMGATLSETTGRVGIEPTWRTASGARLGLEAAVGGAWRPDWPDQYQRTAAGVLPKTDRYSYFLARGGASGWWRPGPGQHLRARYRLTSTSYREDPAFDPATPMHLTPRDNLRHDLDLSWRRLGGSTALGLRLSAFYRQDLVALARNAGTGGTTGNPKQTLAGGEPSVELELLRGGPLELSLRYGLEVQVDTFDGYYSYVGQHPRAVVTWTAPAGLEVKVRGEAWLRTFGASSKSNTEDGARLFDRRLAGAVGLRWPLSGRLSLVGDLEVRSRATNYPDYLPGVFPATRFYDIAWDYTNVRALAGVEWKG
jgi:hypothetical protein